MGKTRDVVERFYECFGANDLDGAFACFAPECIAVGLSGPLDNSAHHAAAVALKNAMPDCHMELVRILEMDDEIYVTGRFKGTHTGDLYTPLGPLPVSAKELDLLFVDYFRVANEKIVDCEVVRDRLGMMIQLGAIPAK
jgi:predicted ester cyclase